MAEPAGRSILPGAPTLQSALEDYMKLVLEADRGGEAGDSRPFSEIGPLVRRCCRCHRSCPERGIRSCFLPLPRLSLSGGPAGQGGEKRLPRGYELCCHVKGGPRETARFRSRADNARLSCCSQASTRANVKTQEANHEPGSSTVAPPCEGHPSGARPFVPATAPLGASPRESGAPSGMGSTHNNDIIRMTQVRSGLDELRGLGTACKTCERSACRREVASEDPAREEKRIDQSVS